MYELFLIYLLLQGSQNGGSGSCGNGGNGCGSSCGCTGNGCGNGCGTSCGCNNNAGCGRNATGCSQGVNAATIDGNGTCPCMEGNMNFPAF